MEKQVEEKTSFVGSLLLFLLVVFGPVLIVLYIINDTDSVTDSGINTNMYKERVKHWVVVQNAYDDFTFSVREKDSFVYFYEEDQLDYRSVLELVDGNEESDKVMPVYDELVNERINISKAREELGDTFDDVVKSAELVNSMYAVMDDGKINDLEENLIVDEGERLDRDFSSVVSVMRENPTSEIAGELYREMIFLVNKDRGFAEQTVVRGFGLVEK